MKLHVLSVINSPNAVQTEDGANLALAVLAELKNGEVEVDFSDISLAISAFFNGFFNTILAAKPTVDVLDQIRLVSIREEDLIVSEYSKRKAIILKTDPEGFKKTMEDLLDESY